MATKLTGWCGKFLAVIFTSIVAPVLVNLAVRDTSDKATKPTRDEQAALRQLEAPQSTYPSDPSHTLSPNGRPLPPCQDALATASRPTRTVRIIVHGVGRTPEAALQDALHVALRQTLASLVDAETWTRNGSALCAGLLRDSSGLLLGWQDLGIRKEWGRKGLCYHSEAAVEVNLTAMAERLRAGYATGWNDPSPATPFQPSSSLPRIQ